MNDQIIAERLFYFKKGQSSNVYNAGKVGFLTATQNNHLIVRSLAYAWKYKKLYESGQAIEEIAKQEGISKRTIYKYLNLAYLSPTIINNILDGKLSPNIQTLFEVASKYDDFEEQESVFNI